MKSYIALVMSIMLAGASLAYAADDKDKGMNSDSDNKMHSDRKTPAKHKAATSQKGMQGSLETIESR